MNLETTLGLLTATTCGEACWSAREDVCRCSCGGRNHGCLKLPDGVQPTRTSKIRGHAYTLAAIGTYGQMEGVKRMIEKQCRDAGIGTVTTASGYTYLKDGLVERKAASRSQVAKWHELAAARGVPFYQAARDLLWVRDDIAEQFDIGTLVEQAAEDQARYAAEREERLAAYR